MKIPLIKSTFYKEKTTKKNLVNFIMNADRLSMGNECSNFEKQFAEWQGKKHCVMFNSGSSANLAIIQTLLNLKIIKTNDNIGFSAITWATNVMPLIQLSLKPIPIDIEIPTLNVSVNTLKKVHEKEKIKCLFLTNLLGFSGDISVIKKYCDKNKIILIEDNCEALGSEYNHKKLGNFGLASTFSFFVGHHMSTIEGGAVCTDNKKIFSMLKMVRSHGWDRSLSNIESNQLKKKYNIRNFDAKYAFYDLAYNLRPTEIQGYLGTNQLKYLDEIITRRENNYNKLRSIYKNKNFIKIETDISKISNFAFPLICKNKKIKDSLINICNKSGIEARPIVGGIISNQPFYKKYIKSKYNLPNSDFIFKNGFYVGNNPEMTKKELEFIIKTLAN